MNVLVIGSGGREHALAWKLAQSPRLDKLFIAPGNAGTSALGKNVSISAEDAPGLVAFARENKIELAIIGPEAPLAAGLADALRAAGIRVFGPSRGAAQIEASKAFAKAFMVRRGIPAARSVTVNDFSAALERLHAVDYPIVIKASGLAAGKGVIIPESPEEAEAALRRIMVEHEFGAAGQEVLIEERLQGEEVSLLAFTDGVTVRPMPPARDHKRLRDGDMGPNTGGMGAYAPTPLCPPALVDEFTRTVLQPAVDGLRAEGYPFIGALYAGLMLTPQGVRVLEFNCRFGDPETQPFMLLLDSDLLEIADACASGCLADTAIHWKEGAAACVVLASEGYPDKPISGRPITGLDQSLPNSVVFHAGTRPERDQVLSAGGRVLGVSGWGNTLAQALNAAYVRVGMIHFDGMQYRRDIGSTFHEGRPVHEERPVA